MVLTLVLPKEYPYALMCLAANFLLCQLLAPIVGLPGRKGAFTAEHLKTFRASIKKLSVQMPKLMDWVSQIKELDGILKLFHTNHG